MGYLNSDDEEDDYDALTFRSKRRNLRQLKQVGSSSAYEDSRRKALLPGKRISKDGNTYWETRRNRTDNKGSNI